jgi:hypothetical protein
MFLYLNFIIYDFFSLNCNPDSGTEFIPNSLPTLVKMAHFSYYNPAGIFVKRDKLLSKLIKFKYENIKLKKKNVKRNMPNI